MLKTASAFVLDCVEEFEGFAFAVPADPDRRRRPRSEEGADVHGIETHFPWVECIRFLTAQPLGYPTKDHERLDLDLTRSRRLGCPIPFP